MNRHRLLFLTVAFILSSWHLLHAQENLTELYFAGNYVEVIDHAAGLIASGDTSFNTFYLKALSEAQLGQPLEAIGTLQTALSTHPGD